MPRWVPFTRRLPIENETPVHTALLLYKARALRGLGLLIAARETLTAAMRRKKGRSEELLRALRYERALVYEDLGQRRRARSELEKLYAEEPDYEDVAAHLGMERPFKSTPFLSSRGYAALLNGRT